MLVQKPGSVMWSKIDEVKPRKYLIDEKYLYKCSSEDTSVATQQLAQLCVRNSIGLCILMEAII